MAQLAEFNIGMGRSVGEILKFNERTIIVRVNRAGKTIRIKRHILKHRVKLVGKM